MKIQNIQFFALLLALTVFTDMTQAQTTVFSYQGSLKDGGTPASGSFQMQFKLFDSLGGAGQIGSTITDVPVTATQGVFSVKLDFGSNALSGANRWLEIAVRHNSSESYTTLAPREQIASSPYSVRTLSAASADGLSSNCIGCVQDSNINSISGAKVTGTVASATNATNTTQLNGQAATFYQNVANLNSGTLDAARLPVPLTLSGTSGTHIIGGQNASTANNVSALYGVSSASTGVNFGVFGQNSSTNGYGVYGLATAFTGATYGVVGENYSTSGRGVSGSALASSGITYGIYGQSLSTAGRGVFGAATAATGQTYGGLFQSDSTNGYGVYGIANAPVGPTLGGWFESKSTQGRGVVGWAAAGTGDARGVFGVSYSTSGIGVLGEAVAISGDARGVYGISNSTSGLGTVGYATAGSGTTYGVYGQADSPSGYGLWASGRTGASGTKSFRIDHPDDPTNKYLLHYSSESPEVINFYRGTVILNDAGEAMVELPSYFAKINKTPSYQLTAVGAPMPMLHIAVKISEGTLNAGANAGPGTPAPSCSFRIAGGAPGAEVSWRVEAVRNDLWVRERGAPVEIEKQDREKGTYQHPEFYGEAAEKGLNYDATRERPKPVRP